MADPSGLGEPDSEVREELTRIGRPIVELVPSDVGLDRAETILQPRAIASGPGDDATGDVNAELARIEHAVLLGMVRVLEEFGDPRPSLKRSVMLTTQTHRQLGQGSIHHSSTWKSVRLY